MLYSHRAQYIIFPPTGVTGTRPELSEEVLNMHLIKIPSHIRVESIYMYITKLG